MKKVFKITIILMILMISFGQLNIVYGAPQMNLETDGGDGGSNPSSGRTYKERTQLDTSVKDSGVGNTEKWKPDPIGINPIFDSKVGIILGVIRAVGILFSVGALIVIGIKEMTASVEEKSNIKKAMPGYVLGVILVATMTTLPAVIYNMVSTW